MTSGRTPRITEDQLRRILTAPAEITSKALAEEMGLNFQTLSDHRARRTRVSIRVALKFGLIPRIAKPSGAHRLPDDEHLRAYVVNGRRG